MQIHPLLVPVLKKIDFSNRYQSLVFRYQYFEKRFISFEIEKVKTIIESFGYSIKYNKSENFFKITEKLPPYKIQFNISLNRGIIEFIYGLEKNGERLKMGGSLGGAIEILTGKDFTIKPKFRNYEDLQEILKEAFSIYEDFKTELLKQENENII